jgi:hypothetical protein
MTWKKLEYGKWPKGKIALRIVSDNGYVQVVIGNIEKNTLNNETYFVHDKEPMIDSIFDTEPHYIELDNLEMPS